MIPGESKDKQKGVKQRIGCLVETVYFGPKTSFVYLLLRWLWWICNGSKVMGRVVRLFRGEIWLVRERIGGATTMLLLVQCWRLDSEGLVTRSGRVRGRIFVNKIVE